jgi:nicotinamidase-related amidase
MMDPYLAPDPARAALIVIDTQNDFTLPEAPARIAGTMEVVPAMKPVLDCFRRLQRPIFHVIRLYQADGANVDLCRRAIIESGKSIVRPRTQGAEIVGDLKLDPSVMLDAATLLAGEAQVLGSREWAIYKPRWSAFYGTQLDVLLKDLDVNTLVFMGCNFPNCPRASIYDASSRDYRIVVASDAISGLYDQGVAELRGIGVNIMTTAEVKSWLAPLP